MTTSKREKSWEFGRGTVEVVTSPSVNLAGIVTT
jgi:hypothetical protein